MYADDTTLISTLETFGNTNRPTEIENNISNEIFKITTWLHSNKLKLNAWFLRLVQTTNTCHVNMEFHRMISIPT